VYKETETSPVGVVVFDSRTGRPVSVNREARRIDAAVDRIRLSGIDLAYEELASVQELRVLITEINAATLKFEAEAMLADPERSLVLRKPLNVQTGQEEGHQGGVRYEAGDAGYAVLRKWVLKQAELQAVPENP